MSTWSNKPSLDIPQGLDLWSDTIRCNNINVQEDVNVDGDVQIDGDLTVDGTINGSVWPSGVTLRNVNPISAGSSFIVQDVGPNLTIKKLYSSTADFDIDASNPDYINVNLAISGVVADNYPLQLDGTQIPRFTVNSSGQLTFADSINVLGYTFVGPSYTYTNVGEAVAANKYNLRLEAGATILETDNIYPDQLISNYLNIEIPANTIWDFDTYNLYALQTSQMLINVSGENNLNSIIQYVSTDYAIFEWDSAPAARDSYLYLTNLHIDNSNPSSTKPISGGYKLVINKCNFEVASSEACIVYGFLTSIDTELDLLMNDCEILVSGTMNYAIRSFSDSVCSINCLRIYGDADGTDMMFCGGAGCVSGLQVYNQHATADWIIYLPNQSDDIYCYSQNIGAKVHVNLGQGGSTTYSMSCNIINIQEGNIIIERDNTKLLQAECLIGTFILDTQDSVIISNSIFNANTVIGAGSTNLKMAQTKIVGTLSIDGSFNNIVTTEVSDNVTVVGDYNTFSACTIGIPPGGAATTITLNLGADNNLVTANKVDSAVVDNGAGNTVAANIVF